MAETETAAVKPGGVIGNLCSQRLNDGGDHGSALSTIEIGVINGIFGHELVIVAGRVNGDGDVAHIEHSALRDLKAHGMYPLAVVDNLLRDDQRLAQLCHDIAYLFAQIGMMHKLLARLFVVTIAGATVNHGEIARFVGRGEVAHGYSRLRRGVRCGGCIIVPGSAGSLVGGVVIFHAQLSVQPEDGSRIAWNMPALPAALMVPGELARNALGATVLGHDFDVIIGDALHDPLALCLEFEELFSNVFGGRIGRIALEDTLRNGATRDCGYGNGNFARHITSQPASTGQHSNRPTITGGQETLKPFSSRASSITSCKIICSPSSISLIMSSTPVICQIKYNSVSVFSSTSHASSVVCRVSGGSARRQISRLSATSFTSGPQSGKASGCNMSGETCVP